MTGRTFSAPSTRPWRGSAIPWYSVPGNHDLALGTPDEGAAVAPFEAVYGPSTYAFHAGPALFVALDDVRPLGGPRYVGGLRDGPIRIPRETCCGLAPPDEWVVLMMHIPLFLARPLGHRGLPGRGPAEAVRAPQGPPARAHPFRATPTTSAT